MTNDKRSAGKNTKDGGANEQCSLCIWKQLHTLQNSGDDIKGEKRAKVTRTFFLSAAHLLSRHTLAQDLSCDSSFMFAYLKKSLS